MKFFLSCLWVILLAGTACTAQTKEPLQKIVKIPLLTGAQQPEKYLPILEGKKIALLVNQTSLYNDTTHLVDFLIQPGITVEKIFTPEHGFRGDADAGERVQDQQDPQTGLLIHSLYGRTKKPSPEMLKGLDLLVFDVQDVGARFYTYISTLHYLMEACAEVGLPLLILDRPNPNGHYVDGPVLDTAQHRSFVGMHPIPVVHGLTVAELAQMINGQKWLPHGRTCSLTLIPCSGYTHQHPYALPVPPSPNLPNARAVGLYPSLCFFEGTAISVGRGTDFPFQVIGHPDLESGFSFTPQPNRGAKQPRYQNQTCYGQDLRKSNFRYNHIQIEYLIDVYQKFPKKDQFFNSFFTKLAGNTTLEAQIKSGQTAQQIRQSWQPDLEAYQILRKKYLLYP